MVACATDRERGARCRICERALPQGHRRHDAQRHHRDTGDLPAGHCDLFGEEWDKTGSHREERQCGRYRQPSELQAVASLRKQIESGTPNDTAIRENVVERLKAESWTRPSLINVIVQDGTVELWGIVDSPNEKKAVRVAAEVTPGVRAVNDNLIIRPAELGIIEGRLRHIRLICE